MFISVRRFETHDQDVTLQEVTDRVHEQLLPEFEEIEGFREYFLVDTQHPRLTSVTICDSREAAEKTNLASQQFVKRAFKPGSVERIDLTEGDVLLAPSVIGHM